MPSRLSTSYRNSNSLSIARRNIETLHVYYPHPHPHPHIHIIVSTLLATPSLIIMATTSPTTAFLLIDIQQGLLKDASRSGMSTPNFEANIIKLLAAFRAAENTHIIHVAHHSRKEGAPLHPAQPGVAFMEYATPLPGEIVRTKHVNSAFVGNDLESVIRGLGIQRLVVVGLTTGHCVSTSVRMASNLRVVDHPHGGSFIPGTNPQGEIIVVSDGTAMLDWTSGGKVYDGKTMHTINLATLDDEFCLVRTTEEVLRLVNGAA
ncbi:isochorismatase hydrolase [Xylaria cf. heliscus]|nr:isochorismatase hydrolase [Xylaria cf. heliscus]